MRISGVITIGFAVAVLSTGVAFNSQTIATTGPVLVGAVAVERRRRRVRDEARGLARLLPPLVDDLIQQLRSGRSLAQSCTIVLADPDHAFAPMADALRARKTLGEAATTLLVSGDPSVRLFAVTVQVLALNGGPAVPALQRLRHTLIGIVHGSEQAEAQSSQSMASAGLMAMSPVVVAIVIGVLHTDTANLYLFEPVGAACVFVAVTMSWIGWWWMQYNLARLERQIA